MSDNRERMRSLAKADPQGWCETMYATAAGDPSSIPWANLRPNPAIVEWCQRTGRPNAADRVLVVGCGLGDDAEFLVRSGAGITAFDVAPSAVAWCRKRFPESPVGYVVADLLTPPAEWSAAFSLVVEANTLQVLPVGLRTRAMNALTGMLAAGGLLLVSCRARGDGDPPGNLPYPLVRSNLHPFIENGLTEITFDDYVDEETPPVRRFRVCYRHGGGEPAHALSS